ncbi:inositol hexakisphosphate and diphosphoinositol-pentakisphosphate kinase 2-like isoform X2 [Clavelina lepadiformis]|uniref:inositol hexakisphosphate and diphosphoinositol-pentakisphosphate kinase 2-like isoform X2 n=1 Tax=Clavelina lepadiformis TaxID=159417 RepID=UPI0040413A83
MEVNEKKIVVGICAMAKKTQSKPMQEILTRLEMFEYISVNVFEERDVIEKPVVEWPHCDCLISFQSSGFPLQKALDYAALRQPFLINDLERQFAIQDRRLVYKILQQNGIETPRYAVCDRNFGRENNFEEYEDHIVVGNEVFHKPFVEKPVDAEDHNIHIYYPSSAGGGCQKLFRKIGNRSSQYSTQSCVRRSGSYIYEDFMPTDGTDVKVYTVGAEYAHAEARKSPALDGKVERDSEGKEVRFPVILSAKEKLIARQVCLAFEQTVCGFDFLRAHGKSFVCDVNGFSFVKNSMKYYDDCAKVLGNIIMRDLAPQFHIPWSIPTDAEDIPFVPTTSGTMMELRCVIAVIRHGDRTPKQKMKMEVRHQKFFDLFTKYNGHKTGKLKLKRPKQLQEVLDVARWLLAEPGAIIEEKHHKVEQLKSVLEMYGHFSGINRKVQFKWRNPNRSLFSSSEDDQNYCGPSLLLILKWGGELTPAGRSQAEKLGQAFRCMYPGGHGDYAGYPGCGLLRLHSTYRHDLKIYASDEGRVQMTAAAFAKGLLALEGELTPILVQMVKSANMNGLLDNEGDSASECQQKVKAKLQEVLNKPGPVSTEDISRIVPLNSQSILKAIKYLENPQEKCRKIYKLMKNLTSQVNQKLAADRGKDHRLYHNESLEIMLQRWTKLERDFKIKQHMFDISKIPDIYDCIKYDLQHNSNLQLVNSTELYTISKTLADVVIPQEYGITKLEKMEIALGYCVPLLRKIRVDLQRNLDEDTYRLNPRYSRGVLSPGRHVRTRLYFTSESHIHSLLTVLQYGGLCDVNNDEQWKGAMEYVDAVSELNYMTQIVIMLYEDPNKDQHSENRFHIELHFSPGAKGNSQDEDFPQGGGFRPSSQPPSRAHSPINTSSEHSIYKSTESYQSESGNITQNTHRKFSARAVHVSNFQDETYGSRRPYELQGGLGSQSSLFSNRVLAGTSASVPALRTERIFENVSSVDQNDEYGQYLVAPPIRPLETLHNCLSLKQMNDFLDKFVKADDSVNLLNNSSAAAVQSDHLFNSFVPIKVQPNEYN